MHALQHPPGIRPSTATRRLAALAVAAMWFPILACGAHAQQNSTGEEKLQVAPMAPDSNASSRDEASTPVVGGPASICAELQAHLSKSVEEKQKDGAQDARQSGRSSDPAKSETQSSAGLTSSVPSGQSDQGASSQAAAAEDPLACRQQVQKMRRAGEKLPPALLALAALKPELLKTSQEKPAEGGASPTRSNQ